MPILTVKLSDPQSPDDTQEIKLEVDAAFAVRNKVKIALGNGGEGTAAKEMQVVGAQQNDDGTLTISLQYPNGEPEVVKTDPEGRLKGYRVVNYGAPSSTP